MATGGVGALAGAAACGALAGAAGNAVSYGITAAQTGDFSWTGLTDSAATGALAGAVGGLAGGLAASGLSAIGDAATSLLGDGAQSIADDASANAAATGTDDTAVLATSPDSADVTGAAENSALSDAPDEAGLGPSCGGASFTAATRVLLASGAAVPIAALHRGEKVLATSTRTGKTRAEAVAAVLVHHDTNRYNLTIRTAHGTAVIHTTRTHLFWAPAAHRWVKAAALRHGTHLATPGRGTATVTGGHTPGTRTDWMWDLTIPADHDFYITAGPTAALVHNCPAMREPAPGGTYQTYTKVNPETGQVYAGRTSGYGTPLENIAERDYGHQYWNDLGFEPAQLDQSSESFLAIRGREQMLIEHYRAQGISANKYNGIRPTNPDYEPAIQAAISEFGPLP